MKLSQIKNRAALYEQVYRYFVRKYEISHLNSLEEPLDCPRFDHTVNPLEHAYVMKVEEFFAMNCRLVENPNAVLNGCLLFTLPTEPNATGSHATSEGFRRKVDAYLSDEVIEWAESMIRSAEAKREQEELREYTRQVALARARGEVVVEVWSS